MQQMETEFVVSIRDSGQTRLMEKMLGFFLKPNLLESSF